MYKVWLKIIETSNFLTRKRLKIPSFLKDTYQDVSKLILVKISWAKTLIQTFTSIFSSTKLCKCNEEEKCAFLTYSSLFSLKKNTFLSTKTTDFLQKHILWNIHKLKCTKWHNPHHSESPPEASRPGSQSHLLERSATSSNKWSQLRRNFEKWSSLSPFSSGQTTTCRTSLSLVSKVVVKESESVDVLGIPLFSWQHGDERCRTESEVGSIAWDQIGDCAISHLSCARSWWSCQHQSFRSNKFFAHGTSCSVWKSQRGGFCA